MTCDLCHNESAEVLRVNRWAVCRGCSTDGRLQHALESLETLRKLTAAVQVSAAERESELDLQQEAVQRIKRAEAELSAAIDALVPLVAKSTRAYIRADEAAQTLRGFRADNPHLKS